MFTRALNKSPLKILKETNKLAEMPVIPKLILIVVVYYGITDDPGKNYRKTEFNESLTSAQ